MTILSKYLNLFTDSLTCYLYNKFDTRHLARLKQFSNIVLSEFLQNLITYLF